MHTRRFLAALLCVIAVATTTACTGVPDRKGEASALAAAVERMPGVDDTSFTYSNDALSGVRMSLSVDMPAPEPGQVQAVAARIIDALDADFDGYDAGATVDLIDGSISFGRTSDPRFVAQLVPVTAEMQKVVGRRVGLTALNDDAVALDPPSHNSEDTSLFLDRILAAAAPIPVRTTVLSGGRGHQMWELHDPVTPAIKDDATRRIAAMPVEPFAIGLSRSGITSLNLEVHPETAFDELSAVIDAAGGKDHRMFVTWFVPGPDGSVKDGTVAVGYCQHPDGESTASSSHRSTERPERSRRVETRVRAAFDTCPS